MALTKCAANVAANAAIDCTTPIVNGLADNGVGIPFEACTFTRDSANPRKITAISIAAGTTAFAIYNPSQIPFADSGSEVNTEGAMIKFNKTLNFNVPILTADGSMNVVEPLSKNRSGFVFIVPTKQKTADGGFIIIGSELGATLTSGTRNLTDATSSAAFTAVMNETGANFETVCLTGATFAAAKVTYEALLANVF